MIASPSPVASGFKLTDAGIIPEDWEVCVLSSALRAGPRNGYSGRSGKDARGTPTLMLSATTSGRMILNDQTVKRLDETLESRSDVFLKRGDVLVQRSNTIDLVGMTAVFDGPDDFYAYPDLMMRLRFKHAETADFFWRYANSQRGRRYFVSVAAGSTGSMPKLSGDKLRNMPLPLPPLAEQEAIAEALGDADALIESLEQLVAKKRHLKQAAMQQLLTGKKRLPGFEGEWIERDLSKLLKSYRLGGNYANNEAETSFPLMKMGNVDRGDFNTDKIEYVSNNITPDDEDRLIRGDVLFNTRNTLDLVGKVAIWREELPLAYFNSNLLRLDFDPAVVGSHFFMNFVMNSEDVLRQLRERATGTTSVAAVYTRDLLNVRIWLPSDRDEQVAIAEVIEDMTVEIEAIEGKLAKARQIKQGMMSVLLTGQVRLVKPTN